MKKVIHTSHHLVKKSVSKKNVPCKVYYIKWRDAFTETDEWHDEDSICDEEYICETIGYLIENNKKSNYFTVASTITNEGAFCSIINIPKSMIITKKIIKLV